MASEDVPLLAIGDASTDCHPRQMARSVMNLMMMLMFQYILSLFSIFLTWKNGLLRVEIAFGRPTYGSKRLSSVIHDLLVFHCVCSLFAMANTRVNASVRRKSSCFVDHGLHLLFSCTVTTSFLSYPPQAGNLLPG